MEVLSSRILLRPSDLERSRRFYRDILGLAVYREFGPPEDPGLVFFLGQGLLEVSGTSHDEPTGPLRIWLQVRDIRAEHERLVVAGVKVTREPRPEPWGWSRCGSRIRTACVSCSSRSLPITRCGVTQGDLPAVRTLHGNPHRTLGGRSGCVNQWFGVGGCAGRGFAGAGAGNRLHGYGVPNVIGRVDRAGPYYRRDLALIHGQGFGFHADLCAPGILALLEPIGERGGLVLELGCGSGLLTRHLVDAGHHVLATDASPAMLDLARHAVPTAEIVLVALPDDPLPVADAVVGVGHVLNYLNDEAAIARALGAIAGALRPGGLLALDLCDLRWGQARRDAPDLVRVNDDWVLVSRFSVPRPDRFVREMTTFVRNADATWRRDDERHDNVLLDTATIPALLREYGIDAVVGTSFGTEQLPVGLMTIIGHRPG
jgi:SAM-dependent methyltransferase/predicted enzyme related to lactoylglutathione lyase